MVHLLSMEIQLIQSRTARLLVLSDSVYSSVQINVAVTSGLILIKYNTEIEFKYSYGCS